MKIRHTIKILEDGKTLCGQILETIFEEGEERDSEKSHYTMDGEFYIESRCSPELRRYSLFVHGNYKKTDNNCVHHTYDSHEEAVKVLAYINEFNKEEATMRYTKQDFKNGLTIKLPENLSREKYDRMRAEIDKMGFENQYWTGSINDGYNPYICLGNAHANYRIGNYKRPNEKIGKVISLDEFLGETEFYNILEAHYWCYNNPMKEIVHEVDHYNKNQDICRSRYNKEKNIMEWFKESCEEWRPDETDLDKLIKYTKNIRVYKQPKKCPLNEAVKEGKKFKYKGKVIDSSELVEIVE